MEKEMDLLTDEERAAEEEFEAAEKAAKKDAKKAKKQEDWSYTHTFKTPFQWCNKKYEEITFRFGSLKGKDILDIDRHLARKGVNVHARAFSSDFRTHYAARVSEPRIGTDVFEAMSDRDFITIDTKARNFLLSLEL